MVLNRNRNRRQMKGSKRIIMPTAKNRRRKATEAKVREDNKREEKTRNDEEKAT